MSDRRGGDAAPIFKPDANATPVSEIKPPTPDPRAARVSKVHAQIRQAVKDGRL